MPQLDLYRLNAATQISWTYRIDPLAPEKLPNLVVLAQNHRGQAVDGGVIRPAFNVVWEEVNEALHATWGAYLFGEQDDVRRALAKTHKAWLAESHERPPL